MKKFEISESTVVYLRTKHLGNGKFSLVVSTSFAKLNTDLSLSLESKFANQYAAGGENALLDGIVGGSEFRTGDWQGYFDQDFTAVIRLKDIQYQSEVELGMLEDLEVMDFLSR